VIKSFRRDDQAHFFADQKFLILVTNTSTGDILVTTVALVPSYPLCSNCVSWNVTSSPLCTIGVTSLNTLFILVNVGKSFFELLC